MRQWLSSSLIFAMKMMISAALSLIGLVVILAIVTRLDVAFFEANGMFQNADLREAFYIHVFEVDNVIFWMLIVGFFSVGVISFLFCKSQFDYFRRLMGAFRLFTEKWEAPPTAMLGRFNPFATYFFDILSRRVNGETEEGLEPLIQRAVREWPDRPAVSISDQLQFAAVAGVLGVFFSSCCVMFYLRVSGRVVELANTIVHFTSPSGPSFLTEQFGIIGWLVWLVLAVTTMTFVMTGYRFGREIAEADYAILRDLKDFMEGNSKQRLFLRANDPAREFIPPMNEALERIEHRLRGTHLAPNKEAAQPAGETVPAKS